MVSVIKLEKNLTASKVIAADKDADTNKYASYGTDVPRIIPGSKQYWKSFGLDLVAMVEMLGELITSPNDNWSQIQAIIKKGWGASAKSWEFNDFSNKSDNKVESVGSHPLESVLGAEKCFWIKNLAQLVK